jgi:hypothetical protein
MSLVVFRSKAAGEIFMFAETARRILAILGKDEHAERGVIAEEEVATALARLQAAVDQERADLNAAAQAAEAAERRGEEEAVAQRSITLAQRAYPLLEMLRAAQKKRVPVTWGV